MLFIDTLPPAIAYPVYAFAAICLLFVVGFGFSLHLVTRETPTRVIRAACIAPAVGLILLGLTMYPLFLNNVLLEPITVPLLLVSLVLNGILLVVDRRSSRSAYRDVFSNGLLAQLAAFLLVIFLIALPAAVGGDDYRYWQANTYDASNYWSVTYAMQHFTYEYLMKPANNLDIVQFNPSLAVALNSEIYTRVVVELPLIWLAGLLNVPIYEFFYYFKLLALMVIYLVANGIGLSLRLPFRLMLASALVLSVGYWSWFVSDIEALSQLFSIPLVLLFFFAWLQLEQDTPTRLFSRQRWLFALALAGLLSYYPEILPLTSLALVIFYLRTFIDHCIAAIARRVVGLGMAAAMCLLLVLPSLSKMITDLLTQSTFATTETSDIWASTFFNWLYTPELLTTRLWGLFFYVSDSPVMMLLLNGLGAVLTIGLSAGIVTHLLKKRLQVDVLMVVSLVVSFWGGAFLIFLFGREWVAGKAVTMGFPFGILAIFVIVSRFADERAQARGVLRLLTIGVTVWALLQSGVPIVRALHFADQRNFSGYVNVQTPIHEINPVIAHLEHTAPNQLVSFFSVQPYTIISGWELMLSDRLTHHTARGRSRYYEGAPIEFWQTIETVPTHIVFDSSANFMQALQLGTLIPLSNTNMQLFEVTPAVLNEAVLRSDLLLSDQEQSFATNLTPPLEDDDGSYRPVEQNAHIRFLAGEETPIAIMMRTESEAHASVSLRFNQVALQPTVIDESATSQRWGVCTMMTPGTNDLIVETSTPFNIRHFRIMQPSLLQLDIGSNHDGLLPANGWYYAENGGGMTWRWTSERASMTLFTCETHDYQLQFRAQPLAVEGRSQRLQLWVNDQLIDTLTLNEGFGDYRVDIPAASLNPNGMQHFVFEHTFAEVPPGDSRALAALYDWVSLAPAQ